MILSIGLFSNLVYADHPEEFITTLDKTSYEFGDMVFGTSQLIAPWDSIYPEEPCRQRNTGFFISPSLFGEYVDYANFDYDTGIITFNYTLTSPDVVAGIYTMEPEINTYVPNPNIECRLISTDHFGVPFDIIVNSDPHTIVLRHMDDVNNMNSTAYDNMGTINDDIESVNSTAYSNKQSLDFNLRLIDTNILSINNNTINIESINSTAYSNMQSMDVMDGKMDVMDGKIDVIDLKIDAIQNTIEDIREDVDELLQIVNGTEINSTVTDTTETDTTLLLELFCGKSESSYSSVIKGTSNADYLFGTKKTDLILGYEGNDFIRGMGGSDCIYGGNGNDFIQGESGNDTIYAGSGDDIVRTGNGNDIVYGEGGNDILFAVGKSGTNTLDGGDGDSDICVPSRQKITTITNNCEILG